MMMWDETRKSPTPMTPEEEQKVNEFISSLFEPRRIAVPNQNPRKLKRKSAARMKVKR